MSIDNLSRQVITKNVTAAYTALLEDNQIICDATAAGFTVTLYKVNDNAVHRLVVAIDPDDSSGNTVTVTDGTFSTTLNAADTVVTLETQYDGSWMISGGSLVLSGGDVAGPASSTDNAIARFDSTTGKIIQNSPVTVADTTGVIAGTRGVTFSGSTSGTTAVVPTAIAGTTTLTLPAATDTLVGKATTDTLTNKTLTSPVLTTPAIGVATGTSLAVTGLLKSSSPTAGVGYATGAGGAVTQGTNRTTGVTLDTITGAITLISAAGSATPASFTVTNAAVAATDVIIVNQKSGTDLYEIFVTAIAAGSFRITSFTTGGTTTEQPVFNFCVLKGVAS